ncbi:unnamed protein product [Rotaria magnacalcarata]|uniref:Hemimethylated DNA-binding domain-containing protein n=1 Tax=Rotaria magnacalcarata TaxID=392030 RepID=A0A8S2JCH0_9BILA|nr:unnamed protein product [Rotaria magnacalcarata]
MDRLALFQFGLLLLAVPLQYFILMKWSSKDIEQAQAMNKITNQINQMFHYLSPSTWFNWFVSFVIEVPLGFNPLLHKRTWRRGIESPATEVYHEYRKQPNYSVLLDTRDRHAHKTYIPQEHIEVVKDTKFNSMATKPIFVVDNGAYMSKSKMNTIDNPRIVPNCVMKSKFYPRRTFIADQIDNECPNKTSLYYQLPLQKGYLVDWNIQKQVWDHLFGKIPFKSTGLLMTEPYMNLNFIRETMDQIFFEEYEVASFARYDPATLSAYQYENDTKSNYVLVVDSGFSFTHIVPFHQGRKLLDGMTRIDVGGKLLTNQLKSVISYRQLLVMNETYIINELKENVCLVSLDFQEDMRKARLPLGENPHAIDYILPDYNETKQGCFQTASASTSNIYNADGSKKNSTKQQQIVRMNVERFTIPEILFRPSTIGIDQAGIAESIYNSVEELPEHIRPSMYNNILLTGGNCLFPNFKKRLENELRSMINDDYPLRITLPENPITHALDAGVKLTNSSDYANYCVTKREYDEHGESICHRKFTDSC